MFKKYDVRQKKKIVLHTQTKNDDKSRFNVSAIWLFII